MRAAAFPLVLAVLLAGCTIAGSSRGPAAPAQPTDDMMPSSVLDRQDPGADTSRNPELSRSGSRSLLGELLDGLLPSRGPAPAFDTPAEAPHYYKGCRGCASDRPGGLPALLIAAGLTLRIRRRRRRAAAAPRSSHP